MKVYVAIALPKDNVPKILGVFKKKSDAEKVAYDPAQKDWANIIEKQLA